MHATWSVTLNNQSKADSLTYNVTLYDDNGIQNSKPATIWKSQYDTTFRTTVRGEYYNVTVIVKNNCGETIGSTTEECIIDNSTTESHSGSSAAFIMQHKEIFITLLGVIAVRIILYVLSHNIISRAWTFLIQSIRH